MPDAMSSGMPCSFSVNSPDAVVYPQSTEDVQRIVRICTGHGVPVIPFGTGTSFEGHVNAPFGGVSIDLKDMNRVLARLARNPGHGVGVLLADRHGRYEAVAECCRQFRDCLLDVGGTMPCAYSLIHESTPR